MLHLCSRVLAPSRAKSTLSPLEAFTQIQLGITPPVSVQRSFLLEYCEHELESRDITEAKLYAMDPRLTSALLRQLVYDRYLSVPFRVFSFDMEFTGPPAFTADGPTEDITEIGIYSPARDETASYLVRPVRGKKLGPGVAELTHITDDMLEREGLDFQEAWRHILEFVDTPEPNEAEESSQRILLLSHGGKLADVSLIKWTLDQFGLELPPAFVFGDTIHLIREAHRRRPVTVDKHPPSWKLGDLVQWLRIPMTLPAHRAGNDAKMTWDALYHTLLRYGDDELTPREQLIPKFFDEEAKLQLQEVVHRRVNDSALSSENNTLFAAADATTTSATTTAFTKEGEQDALDLDFDDIFSKMGSGRGNDNSSINLPEAAVAGVDSVPPLVRDNAAPKSRIKKAAKK